MSREKYAVTVGGWKNLGGGLERNASVASLLRAGMRLKYGTGSEKLVEFGLQPRRRRSRSKTGTTEST